MWWLERPTKQASPAVTRPGRSIKLRSARGELSISSAIPKRTAHEKRTPPSSEQRQKAPADIRTKAAGKRPPLADTLTAQQNEANKLLSQPQSGYEADAARLTEDVRALEEFAQQQVTAKEELSFALQSVQAQLASAEASIASLTGDNDDSQHRNMFAESLIRDSVDNLVATERENEALRTQIKRLAEQSDQQASNQLLTQMSLEHQIKALTTTRKDLADLESQLATTQHENVALGSQCSSLETQCANLETQCANLETQCASLETQCVSLETQCVSLETQCASLESQYVNLEHHCLRLETETEASKRRAGQWQSEALQAQSAKLAATEQSARLQALLDEQIELTKEASQDAVSKIARCTNEIEVLQSRLRHDHGKVQMLQLRCDRKGSDNECLRIEKRSLSKQLAQQKRLRETELSNQQNQQQRLSSQFHAEYQRTETELASQTSDNEDLKQQAYHLKEQLEIASVLHNELNETLKAERTDSKKREAQATEQLAVCSEHLDQMITLEHLLRVESESKIALLQARLTDASEWLQLAVEDAQSIRSQLTEKDNRLKFSETLHHDSFESAIQAEWRQADKIHMMEEQAESIIRIWQELSEQNRNQGQEITALTSQLRSASAQASEHASHVQALATDSISWIRELSDARTRLESMAAKDRAQAHTLSRMKAQHSSGRAVGDLLIEQYQARVEKAKKRIELLIEQRDFLTAKVARLSSQNGSNLSHRRAA